MEERDLIMAEKIGGLTSSVQSMDRKLDQYCHSNEQQHVAIFKKLDSHGKFINRVKGGLVLVSSVWILIVAWIKQKLGGE